MFIALVLLGLAAGFFFTYEVSVTRALAEVDDATYVSTVQAINDTIRGTWFGIVFFGAIPALCAALALHRARGPRIMTAVALAGYVATFAITALGNVPLNDALAEFSLADADVARAEFENDWNRLNLIRTLTCAAGFASLAVAALRTRR